MRISNDAQAVIFKHGVDGTNFLILKRFDKEKSENHFRLVKGGIKKNENAENAIDREVAEETGINNIIDKKYLLHYDYIGGEVKHEVDVFLVKVDPASKITINSDKEGGFTIHEAIWTNSKDAAKKLNFQEEKALIQAALKEINKT